LKPHHRGMRSDSGGIGRFPRSSSRSTDRDVPLENSQATQRRL
jgi:hypothetical protein